MASAAPLQQFLAKALSEKGSPSAVEWLEQQAQKIASATSPTVFFLAFSRSSRYFKKEALTWNLDAMQDTSFGLLGGPPTSWDSLQTARIYLLLQLQLSKEDWLALLQQLFETADMYEQQALYAALPVLPYQEELVGRAIEGCRTNMSVVFDAIALHNPYPAQFFPEANWNQLVLKAIFMQRPLYRIQQLDQRRNPALAAMAIDFAHERWAAGRAVMPELWRLVVPFLDENVLTDLNKALASTDANERAAGALALTESSHPAAKSLLPEYPDLAAACVSGDVTWEKIGQRFQETRS